ncbi:MAG: N-substituted formamide deformylase [Alphaproteobacteria bacterium MarineAlpha11_Bin1]|nr:MAG: N-substituted formamide deformylase [Alphaproteobacteria bacterium MarineAlpha11_Bin1]
MPEFHPDVIVTNGKIATVDASNSIAEAVAMKGDNIVAVGGAGEVSALTGPHTHVVDAGGRTVIPGLIDGHAHMDREGLKDVFPSLGGCKTVGDVIDRIRTLAANAAPGEWIVTMPVGDPPYYWNVPGCLVENRFPTRQELDEAAPDNPVYIRPIWGFWRHQLPLESVVNTQAFDLAGISKNTDPATSTIEFEKDSAGELTGLIREQHFMPVAELGYFHMAPRFTHSDRVAGLKKAMMIYNSTGTTSTLEEHGAAQELINTYQAVHAAGEATVRAHLVYSPAWGGANDIKYSTVMQNWASWLGQRGLGDDWLRVGGMFTDTGMDADAIFRATAAPYTGWSGFNYDNGVPQNRMVEFMIDAARNGIRLAVIGPRFLDMFEEVNRAVDITAKRWVIGHLDVLNTEQIQKAADLGVVMTTHTNRYIYKHGHILREELGRERLNDIAPMRRLLDAGVNIGLATDNVPTTLFYPMWHVVSRWNMISEDRIAPDQALSREDALRCGTMGGAHLTFEEDKKGSIEEGKLGDMAVLSDDPLTCAEEKIKDIVAETTIVGGKIVYEREVST